MNTAANSYGCWLYAVAAMWAKQEGAEGVDRRAMELVREWTDAV